MKVALFLPCYINQFYPQVGKATWQLLLELGCDLDYPMNQSCCGQPMGNSGHEHDSVAAARHFVDVFAPYDAIVAPSGSCTHFVRDHYDFLPQSDAVRHVRAHTYELTEFLISVIQKYPEDARFPYRVGVHNSCHAHRGLGIGSQSELNLPKQPKNIEFLLEKVSGIELIKLERSDECCGFGGTFAVFEEAVSVQMGINRIEDHKKNGAEVITGVDMSCLMHLDGLMRRRKDAIRVMHLAEILISR